MAMTHRPACRRALGIRLRPVLALGLILASAAAPVSAQGTLRVAPDFTARPAPAVVPLQRRLTPAQAASAHAIAVSLARNPDFAAVAPQWHGLVASGGFTDGNIDELVFLITQEAVKQANADKKAYLEKLKGAGDDAPLANVDMQNILQKQQQLLQMLSTISKKMHDAAMATVHRIGG